MPTFKQGKEALDKILNKSRVHLYKPIQIAEILYRHRVHSDVDPEKLDTYRNPSKQWRDQVSMRLLGRVSTSSQKFQDNLFEKNALPPEFISALAKENIKLKGAIEKYIYDSFAARQQMVGKLLQYIEQTPPNKFTVAKFLGMFTATAGLRRSVDKAYEIVVYALFDTIVSKIGATVTLKASPSNPAIFREFEDFTRIVLGIDTKTPEVTLPARLYRVGVTNAADRGLDMWANFGPAIQVKHLTFSEEMAEDVTDQLTADQVVIVCREAEAGGVERILEQLGLSSRVRGVITEKHLAEWYERCLRGKHSKEMATQLHETLLREFRGEFPAAGAAFDAFYKERGYDKISSLA